ncbi:ankyrin repeat domain-containing protein SOWAHA [Chanos chanos]|uniref:Ankyrin repeat domain-containing protein SOWAHA n=1 Tax=Chanos chanos TaxID=29144 RepID=A0A6J2UQP2_CHACN|nr:ankyrin repeat domain-containing protein SOWAHA-like [Chanos chanos]
MALSQETILTFLLEHGGKVKNSELLDEFKGFINSSDPAEKTQNRNLFKSFVNNVAVVKQIDNVKFVVVKKKYQEFVKVKKNQLEDSPVSRNCSFSSSSMSLSSISKREFQIYHSDVENNNSFVSLNKNHGYLNGNVGSSLPDCPAQNNGSSSCHDAPAQVDGSITACSEETVRARVLSVSSEVKRGKTRAVFAIVAVKSPPNSQFDRLSDETDKVEPRVLCSARQQCELSSETRTFQVTTETTHPITNTQHRSKAVEENDLRKTPRPKRRQAEAQAPSSPHLKKGNKLSKPGYTSKYSEGPPLEPTEHEWLVQLATGHWGHVYGLLLNDIQLAEKRDFISGFTALHWAAKSGNFEMVCKIIDISKRNGMDIDVNIKTHDGYTPLHIAAIHNHESVLTLLVRDYGANFNIRDNSGKKPYYYLQKGVSLQVREMLGDPQVLYQRPLYDKTENECPSEVSRGFNTLSRLFQPPVGYRRKQRHRLSFHFVSDDNEDYKKQNDALGHRLVQ